MSFVSQTPYIKIIFIEFLFVLVLVDYLLQMKSHISLNIDLKLE